VLLPNLTTLTRDHSEQLVGFAQRLVQTPSLPGQENGVARLIESEMRHLGYDQVSTDQVGNVLGVVQSPRAVRGNGDRAPSSQGDGLSLMFNGHMDHVDPGDPATWKHPPHSGKIVDGELWGRATVDMKGPLAAMIYAGGLVKQYNLPMPGDLIVASVVMEEGGGVGTHHLLSYCRPAICVVGESSDGWLMRGHRGRVELIARVAGRAVHASVPEQGANPHYPVARFLTRLETLPMDQDAEFGPASVAPTLFRTDQGSSNVTPGEAQLTLDWRTLPGQTPEQITAQLQQLLEQDMPPDFQAEVRVVLNHFTTYTGVAVDLPASFPPFSLPSDHWVVLGARQVLSQALERSVSVGIWRFATDGGQAAALGIPTIGFGPGDPNLVHTNRERISTTALIEGLVGYLALATGLPRQSI
jgi:succinyl-diaminopimelate desuccinylase